MVSTCSLCMQIRAGQRSKRNTCNCWRRNGDFANRADFALFISFEWYAFCCAKASMQRIFSSYRPWITSRAICLAMVDKTILFDSMNKYAWNLMRRWRPIVVIFWSPLPRTAELRAYLLLLRLQDCPCSIALNQLLSNSTQVTFAYAVSES